ncbi:MAG: WbqC family protein [Nitrosopumilus sp.]|nr:WbqC family protein [Nitrosopumilus sp.]
MSIILPIAYLPPISWFSVFINYENVLIEKQENYIKQTYRNRCRIFSANGVIDLTIPVKHQHKKIKIDEVEISYKEDWQKIHWRAIFSAYNNSPYFEFFKDELEYFCSNKFKYLFDYNLELIKLVLKLMKLKSKINFTNEFAEIQENDFRKLIHPKKENLFYYPSPYEQVFSSKFNFTPNLSILDLLCMKGTETLAFLGEIKLP